MAFNVGTRISVTIPVGPQAVHARWLPECLASLAQQSRPPDVVLLVDDMHGLTADLQTAEVQSRLGALPMPTVLTRLADVIEAPVPATLVWSAPWRLGVATAFNVGCALGLAAGTDLCVMLGSDDMLEPRALEQLHHCYQDEKRRDGYYWFDVQYDTGETQGLPCNAAAMTAGFMRATGGLPLEASLGGMDAALVSTMLTHDPETLVHVPGDAGSRYWVRQHADQEGAALNRFGSAIVQVRDVITQTFQRPDWGRYVEGRRE